MASCSISLMMRRRIMVSDFSSTSSSACSSRSLASSCSMRMASSRASWRSRISRMSSACRSESWNASISAGLGSSLSRMMRITSSIFSSTSIRPSRMWMRSSTLFSWKRVRRVTVSKRNPIHSRRISCSPFWRGRPSVPIITRLIGAPDSRLVCASRVWMNSCWSTFLLLGSNTSRTGASLPDSSRTASSTASSEVFSCTCSGVSAFLPVRIFGLVISSISSSTFCADVAGGSSCTTICHWPRAISSIFQRARTFRLPRPPS
ncbi:hypothetical protein D3C86_1351740 [compost metagenome]